MNRILLLIFSIVLFTSCEQKPDSSNLAFDLEMIEILQDQSREPILYSYVHYPSWLDIPFKKYSKLGKILNQNLSSKERVSAYELELSEFEKLIYKHFNDSVNFHSELFEKILPLCENSSDSLVKKYLRLHLIFVDSKFMETINQSALIIDSISVNPTISGEGLIKLNPSFYNFHYNARVNIDGDTTVTSLHKLEIDYEMFKTANSVFLDLKSPTGKARRFKISNVAQQQPKGK